MKKVCGFALVGVTALIAVASAHAEVSSPPLTQVVTAGVKDCSNTGPVSNPLITWGGDIATVYANGSARHTVQGSIFANNGLSLSLVRQDVFAEQVASYLRCDSPYLRGTMGMINMAAEVAARDPRTALHVIYQLTFSFGGDSFVARDGIKSPKDLKGKTIAVQAYGPHVYYMTKVLADGGLKPSDVKIRWTKDLVGFEGDTPAKAFHDDSSVDATFVITPDALALTSGGAVGTGTEDSVRGATIMLSTKTANRVIADVYAVRADYLKAHRAEVQNFVHALMVANEQLASLMKGKANRSAEYTQMISGAADILMDSPQAVADTSGMYGDAEFVGWKGNVKFFGDPNYPRNFNTLTKEIQESFVALGLLGNVVPLEHPRWDYAALTKDLADTSGVEAPRFDVQEVAKVVTRKQQQNNLNEGELFSFEVYFRPNQNAFSADLYASDFSKVIEMASTYGGAIVIVEGHSDPLGYLRAKERGTQPIVLKTMIQSTKNLSLSRANQVRDNVIAFAAQKGVTLDPSQLTVVGQGIDRPKTGMCGVDPCLPKTEAEWLSNMRVRFSIVQIEAEAQAFKPLGQ